MNSTSPSIPIFRTLGLGLVLSFTMTALRLDAAVAVARGGEARARIVVAADAAETDRFAADELALFLHIVTGAKFPVGEDGGASGGRLLVGPGAARLALPANDIAGLAPE